MKRGLRGSLRASDSNTGGDKSWTFSGPGGDGGGKEGEGREGDMGRLRAHCLDRRKKKGIKK